LFMVDVTCGIHELDTSVASLLRKTDKKVMLVVNKVDNAKDLWMPQSFTTLAWVIIFH